MTPPTEQPEEFKCAACKRTFVALPSDVERAGGHLCIAADRGLSQREGLEELRNLEITGE